MNIPPIPEGAKLHVEDDEGVIKVSWPVPAGEFRRKCAVALLSTAILVYTAWQFTNIRSLFSSPSWIQISLGALLMAFVLYGQKDSVKRLLHLGVRPGHALLTLEPELLQLDPGAGRNLYTCKRIALFQVLILADSKEVFLGILPDESCRITLPAHREALWLGSLLAGWMETGRPWMKSPLPEMPASILPSLPPGKSIRVDPQRIPLSISWTPAFFQRVSLLLYLIGLIASGLFVWIASNMAGINFGGVQYFFAALLALEGLLTLFVFWTIWREHRTPRPARLLLYPDALIYEIKGRMLPEIHRKTEISIRHLPGRIRVTGKGLSGKPSVFSLKGKLRLEDKTWLKEVLTCWESGSLWPGL